MAVQNFGSGGGGFQISPGVNVSEIDLTTVVPPTATTVGAIAGVFRWGPVGVRQLITSENDLVRRFGKPTSINPETFFTAASFLSYSNALYVSRAANTEVVLSAVANSTAFAANAAHTIKNRDDYDAKAGNFSNDVEYIAKYPGAIGNSLKVSVCDSTNAYSQSFDLQSGNTAGLGNNFFNGTKLTISVGENSGVIQVINTTAQAVTNTQANAYADSISALFAVGDFIEVGNSSIGRQTLKITSKTVVSADSDAPTMVANVNLTFDQPLKLSTDIEANAVTRYWEYFNQFDSAPGTSLFQSQTPIGNTSAVDELHVVVADEDGQFTGSPGAILEVFGALSRAADAKNQDGSANYYKTVLNERSQYLWWASDRDNAASATAATLTSSTNDTPLTISFQGGVDNDETTIPFADTARAYDLYNSAEDVDISLVLAGRATGGTHGEQQANYLIDNIAEVRKDCIVFVSPARADVVNNVGDEAEDIVEFRNALRSTSFAVCDSGYKYMYDKYNDIFRFIPLNGDIAGTCVVTDNSRDPWYSPAGTSRGQVRNIVRLAFNPNKAERDLLYKNGINPVITQPGQGTILFGDKTLLNRPSAFDRINVRRLFIVLEKSISRAAKSLMFEFNDEFTRTQFRNLVEPFLRDVQGRRGITDFRVVCDETNNTAEVVDTNRFVGDIYIKPARSINFIQLNFVAVRSGIEFSEIVG
jgi:hypothetical protein